MFSSTDRNRVLSYHWFTSNSDIYFELILVRATDQLGTAGAAVPVDLFCAGSGGGGAESQFSS